MEKCERKEVGRGVVLSSQPIVIKLLALQATYDVGKIRHGLVPASSLLVLPGSTSKFASSNNFIIFIFDTRYVLI